MHPYLTFCLDSVGNSRLERKAYDDKNNPWYCSHYSGNTQFRRLTLVSCVAIHKSTTPLERVRLKLISPHDKSRNVGFVTLTSWNVKSDSGSSTVSTPSHHVPYDVHYPGKHKRSMSLPSSMHHR